MHTPPARSLCVVRPALAFESALVLIAFMIGWAVAIPPFGTVAWSWSAGAVATLATLPPLCGLWLTLRLNWAPFRHLRAVVDLQIYRLFARCGPVALVVISAVAGIGEETLFRGVLQPALGTRLGDLGGLLGAGALFGLAHSVSGLYALLAGLMGIYLGAVFLVTGNIVVPIVVHALYDLTALWCLVRSRPGLAHEPGFVMEDRT